MRSSRILSRAPSAVESLRKFVLSTTFWHMQHSPQSPLPFTVWGLIARTLCVSIINISQRGNMIVTMTKTGDTQSPVFPKPSVSTRLVQTTSKGRLDICIVVVLKMMRFLSSIGSKPEPLPHPLLAAQIPGPETIWILVLVPLPLRNGSVAPP